MRTNNSTSLRNKKGITIVELTIVIAVIGILVAILIPTFASIIDKANVSSDVSACKDMNNALTEARAEHNGQLNYSTAKDALKEAGYAVSRGKAMGENGSYYFVPELGAIVYVDTITVAVVYPTEYKNLTINNSWIKLEQSFAENATSTGMALSTDLKMTENAEVILEDDEGYVFDLAGKTLDLGGCSLAIEGDTTGTVVFTNGNLTNGTVLVNIPNGDVEYSAMSSASVDWKIIAVKDGVFKLMADAKINGTLTVHQGNIEVADSAYIAELRVLSETKAGVNVVVDSGASIAELRVASDITDGVKVVNYGDIRVRTDGN